ncbi:MAG: aldehyde dehydrogenase family protein [bacterium]
MPKGLILNGEVRFTDLVKPIKSPWSGEVVGECCFATQKEVEEAIELGSKSARTMANLRSYQRAEILHRTSDLITQNKDRLATTIASEGGKPIKEARVEVSRAETTFRIAAEEARRWGGEILPLDINPLGGDRLALVRRFPVGLVTGISPFNFPLNLVAHKIAPALATGCAINLKPASYTPLTALILGEILLEAGLPPGACNILPLSSDLATPLVEDDRVKLVTFTGSAEVGWGIKQLAWNKKVCLELGGNAAAVVDEGCDLEYAARRIVVGGYAHSGQICISVQHVLIHRKVYDEFLNLYLPMVKDLRMGDPLDGETDIAALIDEKEAVRVEEWIKEAIELGGRVLLGGNRESNRIEPTVLENVPPNARISWEEVFGPVTLVSAVDNLDEALERINSWQFGLQTGIFTPFIDRALRAFNRLEVGGIIINDIPTFRMDNYPYGGMKRSGFGREGVKYAMEEMTELRTLVIPNPR